VAFAPALRVCSPGKPRNSTFSSVSRRDIPALIKEGGLSGSLSEVGIVLLLGRCASRDEGWHRRWNLRRAKAAKPITLLRVRRGWMLGSSRR